MKKHYKTEKINITDVLLIVGFVTAPMDSLRFAGKVGIAELAIFLCGVYAFIKRPIIKTNIFLKFWFAFILAILAGSGIGIIIAPEESTFKTSFPIYVFFFFMSITLYDGLENISIEHLITILNKICICSSLLYIVLFILSKYVGISIPGARMWMYSKFTGGAENPNKLSVYMSEIVFINVFCIYYFMKDARRTEIKKTKLIAIHIICIVFSYYIGTKTGSSMFYVSIVGSTLIVVFLYILITIKSESRKMSFVVIAIVLPLLVLLIFYNQLYTAAYQWVASDDNGLSRFIIFASIKYTLRKSAIFGLGPGIHALNGTWSYHNTFLEILAMSGFIGLFIFFVFLYRIWLKCKNDLFLLTLIIPLLIYSLGSFAIRNIEFWFVCVITCVLSNKMNKELI